MRSKLIYLDLQRATVHYHGAVGRKTVTVAYNPEFLGFDISELLQELSRTPGSVYFNRSIANLGGMLLAERVQEEIDKLRSKSQKRAS